MVRPPYRRVARLIFTVAGIWEEVEGEAASRGASVWRHDLSRWLSLVWYQITRRIHSEERLAALEAELSTPLPGEKSYARSGSSSSDDFQSTYTGLSGVPGVSTKGAV